jgi:hypothetical protein
MVRRALLLCAAALLLLAGCDGCSTRTVTTTTEPATGSITTVDAPATAVDGDPVVGARRGMGWYPNIEADDDNRLHMAWVDADAGDVRYAVTAPAGSALAEPPAIVDGLGAVGGFLRLALGPGGVPLLTYSRQDTGIFRFAWRPVDRERAGVAGAVVDAAVFPELPMETTSGGPVQLLNGFVGEEVGYGEQVGRGSSLAADAQGRVAIAYYSADDRLRLARRPSDVAAFSVDSLGVLEKRDLDGWARGSTRVVSDTAILADGTVVVAYAHDVATDARLRLAVLPADGSRPRTIEDTRGPTVTLDGLTSRLIPRDNGTIDVVAHDKTAGAVVLRSVDLTTVTWLPQRTRLIDVDGVAVTVPRGDGGWYSIARVRDEGLFLYVVEPGPIDDAGTVTPGETRRVRLEGKTMQVDTWIDVVTRRDGRPAAVWFSTADESIKLYAP